MTILERKTNALNAFLDELWTACAEGQKFFANKCRRQHSLTPDYSKYIMDNCVEKRGLNTYTVKAGQRKLNICETLSVLPVLTVREANSRGTDLFAPKVAEVSTPQTFTPAKSSLKHLAPGDKLFKSMRLESSPVLEGSIETSTKKEVMAASKQIGVQLEIDELSGRKIHDSVITLKVTRAYPGGSDSTEFDVRKNLDYNGLLSLVNKFKEV